MMNTCCCDRITHMYTHTTYTMVHTHTHTHAHIHRHTHNDTQTHTQWHTDTHTMTHRHTHRHTHTLAVLVIGSSELGWWSEHPWWHSDRDTVTFPSIPAESSLIAEDIATSTIIWCAQYGIYYNYIHITVHDNVFPYWTLRDAKIFNLISIACTW